MLSYRHSFHAGNFADVVKHIVLVEILDHLTQKETPFEYIDTHSGAGLFNLKSTDAQKIREHVNGINKISLVDFPELSRYFEVIKSVNLQNSLDFYPGSPAIAKHFLRRQDRAWLFELHPKDYELLRKNIGNNRKIKVKHQDGFDGINALLPPTSRRGLVLIDPSYEIKSDYEQLVKHLASAHKKFTHGTYAIWYPVVDRNTIDTLEKNIIKTGIKNIQRFELGITADSDERGMTASGMIVINPPWKLFDKMTKLLPKLEKHLGEKGSFYKCIVMSKE